MALSLPSKFAEDIQGKNISIVPLVTIESPSSTSESIYLSTHSIDVFHASTWNFPNPFNFKPLLLNISSFKESIDIEKRKYKISNITLSISNLPYEGVRFSDRVVSEDNDSIPDSLINATINIQWKSPRSKYFTSFNPKNSADPYNGLSYYEYFKDSDDICLMVYSGIIRKYTHDDTKVILTIEDRTELDFHQDLPIQNDTNWLSTDSSVPEKYRGKPKPMVYGYVDKSPCVLDANGQVVIDSKPVNALIKRSHYIFGDYEPLYMASGDSIVSVAKTVERDLGSVIPIQFEDDSGETVNTPDAVGKTQWSHSNNNDADADNIIQLSLNNPLIINNAIQCTLFHKASSVFIGVGDDDENIIPEEDMPLMMDHDLTTGTNINNSAGLSGTFPSQSYAFYVTYFKMTIGVKPSIDDSLGSRTKILCINEVKLPVPHGITGNASAIYLYPIKHSTTSAPDTSNEVLIGTYRSLKELNAGDLTGGSDYAYDLTSLFGFPNQDDFSEYDYSTGGTPKYIDMELTSSATKYTTDDEGVTTSATQPIHKRWIIPSLWCYDYCGLGDHQDAINEGSYEMLFRGIIYTGEYNEGDTFETDFTFENANINEVDVKSHVDIKNIYEKQFFATVKGRTGSNPAKDYLRQPTEIITDIIREIKNDPDYEPEKRGFGVGNDQYESLHSRFINDFTINKKIGSKKLIENILSTTPFIGRFANNGKFVFNEIPKSGGTPLYTIKEEDVINFSFSKTETIYTKVILKSKINYLTDEFENITEANVNNLFSYFDQSTTPVTQVKLYDYAYYGLLEDDSQSTLIIDDDRGKYIRDKDAAERLTYWLLSYYANAHLKLRLDLGLHYLNAEVGDIINFNKLIQGIKPYGINYIIDGEKINGQVIFPTFIVTSTVKTLDKVTIECVQNHALATQECSVGFDCFGECGGTAELDVCGVCDDAGLGETDIANCVECPEGTAADCLGVCGGGAVRDACGVCEGTCDGTPEGDCDFECGCADSPEGDCDCYGTKLDCNNDCGGDAFIDNCGNCAGGNTGEEPCAADCLGDLGGTATEDVCGYCASEDVDVDECFIEYYLKINSSTGNSVFPLKDLFIWSDGFINETDIKPTPQNDLPIQVPTGSTWQYEHMNNEMALGFWKVYCYYTGFCNSGNTFMKLYDISYHHDNSSDLMKLSFESEDGRSVADGSHFIGRFRRLNSESSLFSPDKIQITSINGDVLTSDDSNIISIEESDDMVQYSNTPNDPNVLVKKYTIVVNTDESIENPPAVGDLNNDGVFNVLDIVTLANAVLQGDQYNASGDMNGDGSLNVLDVVILANCILNGTCTGEVIE